MLRDARPALMRPANANTAIASAALIAATAMAAPPSPEGIELFEKSVRPVLVAHCSGCHSVNANKVRGGLKLDSLNGLLAGGDSGPAIVPGDPDASLLVKAIRYTDPDTEMPPKGKLPDDAIRAIERWVAMGAPHPDALAGAAPAPASKGIDIAKGREFWAYRVPVRPEEPAVKDAAWAWTPIDRFLLARIEEAGLRPQADADRRTLIRRLSFDLTGLPPSPEEIDRFVRDQAPDAYEQLVERYLASPAYGERWGRHWLDVARYAESSGKESNVVYPHAWRYRDYVIDSFAEDKPYDVFLREQLAGDLLPAENDRQRAEQLIATGYLAIGTKGHNTRGKPQFTMDLVDEQVDAISQGLLATTVACARCHDHKFDPIPQRDYYAMAGILMSTDTRYGTYRGLANDHPAQLVELPKGAGLPLGPTMPGPVRRVAEQQRERAATDGAELAALQAKAREARRPGSQVKLTAQEQAQLVRARTAEGREEAAADLLARFGEDGKATPLNLLAMGAAEAEQPRDAKLLARGELTKPGETVPRGFPQVLSAPGTKAIKSGSGRKELADWIASESNPLTARVWVNRVWLHLVGQPIVPTPDNFGASGTRPSHPELLDWLAVQFMDDEWSTKTLIRRIVLSHAYRMGSGADTKSLEADPDNKLVWRMPRRRLEGEAIRDAMLAAAGTLDEERPVGSPVAFLEGSDRSPVVAAQLGSSRTVRSVYLPVLRDNVDEMLDVFDFAEPAYVSGDRDETSVPTQALFMMNDERVLEASLAMARRVMKEGGTEAERINRAFLLALGRRPEQSEVTAVRSFFKDFPAAQGAPAKGPRRQRKDGGSADETLWAAFCQALFQSAEFRMID